MVVIRLVPHECCNFSACSVYTIQPELCTSLQKKERCFSIFFFFFFFFFRFDLTLCLCGHKEVMIMQLISFVVGGGGGVLLLLSV